MHHADLSEIARAIKNCTDILGEETSTIAKNVVIFTVVDYGRENEAFIARYLK